MINTPFGDPQILEIAATGNTAVTVKNFLTKNSVIPTLTGNATLTVTKDPELKDGAVIHLVIKTTATETFTFAGDIVAPVVTGVGGKTWSQGFILTAGKFYPMGAKIQVD